MDGHVGGDFGGHHGGGVETDAALWLTDAPDSGRPVPIGRASGMAGRQGWLAAGAVLVGFFALMLLPRLIH